MRRKLDIDYCRKFAQNKGGECTSSTYRNTETKLSWKCEKGHSWLATPHTILRGSWCPVCSGHISAKIEDMQALATKRGGQCLSDVYSGVKGKLRWSCASGHFWDAVPLAVKNGTWCPHCAGNAPLSILEMKEMAGRHGGECLSEKYVNSLSKLKWRCEKGHEWEATPSSIKGGHWCPVCGGNRVENKSLELASKIARDRGGECISDKYLNYSSPLKWRCKMGHEWKTSLSRIENGGWCAKCSYKTRALGRRNTIAEMREIARSRGGECLSNIYVGNKSKLTWKCKLGHVWEASPSAVQTKTWCPTCGGSEKKTLDEISELARKRGGRCLSEEYVNGRTKMRWECAVGHKWEANAVNIQSGRWCPVCASGISERVCRAYFEELFGVSFKKAKPSWLMNWKGNKMEFDGFNETLKIAFEYHGKQHYKSIKAFSGRQLDEQQRVDELKRRLCEERGVRLIEVPYNITYEQMPLYITNECKKQGIIVAKTTRKLPHELGVSSPKWLNDLKRIASEKGGQCLSAMYLGDAEKLEWRCELGHVWLMKPSNIKQGQWCPTCGGTKKKTIEEMRELARERGGKCHASEYVNGQTKMLWECAKGHTWTAKGRDVVTGSWCPKCSGREKKSISDMQRLASSRGGTLLSSEYKNNKTNMWWRCKNNHEWLASAHSILNGTWCPECAKQRFKNKKILL